MENFVPFEIAKKLKEKGFTCQYPIAMYNELGSFHALYTSADHNPNIKSVFGNREYYDYDDFDDKDCVCPTISQVLKWLREKKNYHIEFVGNACGYLFIISDVPSEGGTDRYCSDYSGPNDGGTWDKYEDCAIASIEYVLDNLI